MEISALLEPLNLKTLDREWVNDIWDKEFLENIDLPREYEGQLEELEVNEILHSFIKATKAWLHESEAEGQDESVDRSWRNLVNTIDHRELTTLLFHLIQKGPKNVLNDECRAGAILAGRTYFTMLMIPGSGVYRIFHSQMYVQCLTCFKYSNQILEQHEYFNDAEEMNILNRQLKSLLNDLHILIYNINLKSGDDDSVEETICCLVEFIGNTNMDSRIHLDKIVLSKLSELALKCIELLIQGEEDEDPDETVISLIFKALLPKFTSLSGTKKTMMLWRASGVTYCGALLLKYGATAIPGFTCLLQHLCFNSEGMERVDNRSSRVKLVAGLLSLMPLQPYTQLLEWIVKLSRNAKSQLRLFAVELLGSLVAGEDRNFSDAVSRGDDDANVSTMSTIHVPSPEPVPFTSAEPVSSTSVEPDPGLTAELDSESPGSSVPEKHQQMAHRDLLRVVSDRCRDNSSTVRTRAVTILAACSASASQTMKATIKEVFGGEEGLLQLAVQKLKDERVTVRRTAMILVQTILRRNEALVTEENLNPMVGLCRDISIMVRCAAVTCLTELAQHWSNTASLEAWLVGPLNQLADPEVKVQELVVESLRTLLFSAINPHSLTLTVADRRPWMLLAAIIRKNMRRHLARGTAMLAKSSKILSFRLVDTLYTHLGTENNLPCWVLLSCVARHIQVSDIHFVLDYYNDLTPEIMFGDTRLVTLVLEVLREWSKSIPEMEASILRSRLIRSLRDGALPSAGARGAVALAARLTRLLGGDTRWACDLMREGELKLLQMGRQRGQIQGVSLLAMADLALAAERRPSQEIIELLLDLIASFDSSHYDDVSVGVRACAVAALGKLSIRERSTAGLAAPLCAGLLSAPHCPLALKVNAMCVLADLCTRFTSIVEPMLPSVCACLGSSDTAVRRCAAQLVTQLLVGDFLRLRGSLYFHYFPLVSDEDETVRDVANYYILNCLVQRNKNILYHNFVECIFYYNRFEDHAMYAKFHVTDEEKRLFTLHGEDKRPVRLAVYDLMLSHMSDVQRLNTQVKLCKEVGTVGDAGAAGADVLRDAVFCLRRAARPPQARQASDDMATRVTTNIVSQKIKLNVMEMVVPTVMLLHRRLRAASSPSPLVPDLLAYACDLLRDYKSEIGELFETDTELMDEIKLLQASTAAAATAPSTSKLRVDNIPVGFEKDDTTLPVVGGDADEQERISETPLTRKAPKPGRSVKRQRESTHSRGQKARRSLALGNMSLECHWK